MNHRKLHKSLTTVALKFEFKLKYEDKTSCDNVQAHNSLSSQ